MSIREGYFNSKGSEEIWRLHFGALLNGSPFVYTCVALAAGSLMLPFISQQNTHIVYIANGSTTGKTVLTKILMSLRSNPQDITWCFDSTSTLDMFVHDAHELFLCLDDAQQAIIPDKKGIVRGIPDSFFEKILNNNTIKTTLFVTSLKNSHIHHSHFYHFKDIDIFENKKNRKPWWMDEHLIELYMNYGFGVASIQDFAEQHEWNNETQLDAGILWIRNYFNNDRPHVYEKYAYELLSMV